MKVVSIISADKRSLFVVSSFGQLLTLILVPTAAAASSKTSSLYCSSTNRMASSFVSSNHYDNTVGSASADTATAGSTVRKSVSQVTSSPSFQGHFMFRKQPSTTTAIYGTNQDKEESSSSLLQQQQQQYHHRPEIQIYPVERYQELQSIHFDNPKANIKIVRFLRHAEGTHNVHGDYLNIKNVDARLTTKGIEQCRDFSTQLLLSSKGDDSSTVMSIQHEVSSSVTSSNDKGNINRNNIMIVTSPLTRCIQTALYCFPWLVQQQEQLSSFTMPIFVAHEGIRETVNYNCDRRRTIQELQDEFPTIYFEFCPENEDSIWQHYEQRLPSSWDTARESAELHVVARRGRLFFQDWLFQRKNTNAMHRINNNNNNPRASEIPDHVILSTHSAFLRAILNWGQTGGVPKLPPQRLVDGATTNTTNGTDGTAIAMDVAENQPIFEYCGDKAFEEYMRRDFENCELRSCCMVSIMED